MQNYDFYAQLAVKSDATPAEIRASYRKLSKQCHPDKVQHHRVAEATYFFKRVQAAYDVLSDAQKRRIYDGLSHVVSDGPAPQFQPSRREPALADRSGEEVPPKKCHSAAAEVQTSDSCVASGGKPPDDRWQRRAPGGQPTGCHGGASDGQPSDERRAGDRPAASAEEGMRSQSSKDVWKEDVWNEVASWKDLEET